MIAPEPSNRLDEILVAKEFDVAEALSSIQFYFNLAKQHGQKIVVEIWREKKDGHVISNPSEFQRAQTA